MRGAGRTAIIPPSVHGARSVAPHPCPAAVSERPYQVSAPIIARPLPPRRTRISAPAAAARAALTARYRHRPAAQVIAVTVVITARPTGQGAAFVTPPARMRPIPAPQINSIVNVESASSGIVTAA